MNRRAYPLEDVFRRIVSPFEQFLGRTSAGGILLLGATVLALAVATALGESAVDAFWERVASLDLVGGPGVSLTLHDWVNEALMALFFLLVGLEIKREILVGELSSLRDALLPAAGALGGVVVPALIYLGLNAGTPAARGWAVPTATDIAFAIGVLVMLAERVPRGAIVFMTALAIADDLFAVLAIAFFYASDVQVLQLQAAGLLFLLLVIFNRAGIRSPIPYAVVGAFLWYSMLHSGVHATLAGLLTALAIPARSRFTAGQFRDRIEELYSALPAEGSASADEGALSDDRVAGVAEAMERTAIWVQSPLQRIEHRLTPWVAFVVVPLFALANAGIDLRSIAWDGALAHPVTLGVAAGLVLGKLAGISAFSWVAVRLRLARLAPGVGWRHIVGCAWLGGIGFTMSLFIGGLAFEAPGDVERAKLGTMLASLVAGVAGVAWLMLAARGARSKEARAGPPP
ncbi:MAG TPA: Na+/H+ antiporter NhaA [Usitatibacter sp.]|nr:Na+/H+ antiporter NhaA [Usitatibacter sp.]